MLRVVNGEEVTRMIRVSFTRFVYTDFSAPTLVIRMSSFLLALGAR